MARRDTDRDFIESIARGLDVIKAFSPTRPTMSLSEVATQTDLARPTARRILRTLEQLGYVRATDGRYALTPRILELGVRQIQTLGLWDIARPHLEDLVSRTHESSSVAQLDGSDIVYVSRVQVPKLIALAVQIGTRFPAAVTSLGKVLLADLSPDELDRVLEQPTRSGVVPKHEPDRAELDALLRDVRAKGWASTDEHLASGVRSAAAPIRDGSGRVVASVNVTVHAAETSLDTLLGHHLPLLLRTASDISADFTARGTVPVSHAR